MCGLCTDLNASRKKYGRSTKRISSESFAPAAALDMLRHCVGSEVKKYLASILGQYRSCNAAHFPILVKNLPTKFAPAPSSFVIELKKSGAIMHPLMGVQSLT
jgi:hypothetical protein